MAWLTRHFSTACILAAFAVLLTTTGCGDGRPPRVPVAGQVVIDGKPLSGGFIRLVPVDARPATARISSDGHFQMSTFDPGDGCVVGTHGVEIIAIESKNNGTSIRWLVPAKYHSAATSGTTVTIDGPTDSLEVDLTWKGSGRTGPYEIGTASGGDFDPSAPVD